MVFLIWVTFGYMYPHMHRLEKMQIQIHMMQKRPDTCKPSFTPSTENRLFKYTHMTIHI